MNKLDSLYEMKKLLEKQIEEEKDKINYPHLVECDRCKQIKPCRTANFDAGHFGKPILYRATMCKTCVWIYG